MGIERQFLGWDGPCLLRAARWLIDRYAAEGVCDLSRVLVVTSGRRANRRLLELLVSECGQDVLMPPVMATPGRLPELLYHAPQQVASDLQGLLIRAEMLSKVDRQLMKVVTPHRPEDDLVLGWINLAKELAGIESTLAAESIAVGEVAGRCAAMADFNDDARWQLLAELQNDYERCLHQRGMVSQDMARQLALQDGRCELNGDVVLVSLADLNHTTRRMLQQAEMNSEYSVTALIHCPEEHQQGFDAFGCLDVDYWHDITLDIDDEQLKIVDQPGDQARTAVCALSGFAAGQPIPADQITVGLGDEALADTIARTFELAGIASRSAVGVAVSQSRPGLLLAGFGQYFLTRRLDDFAALVRHPDLESHLGHALKDDAIDGIGQWLNLLDHYMTEHLAGQPTGWWLGDEKLAAKLRAVQQAVDGLWEHDPHRKLPLPTWSQLIADLLSKVYEHRPLHRHDPADEQLAGALELIAGALRKQAELDIDDAATPCISVSQAITFTLSRLSDAKVAPAGMAPAAELLGWLELQMDDAANLVITGVNEGIIPQSVSADAFLPDHTRRVLGLTDNRRRYARDMLILQAIMHSRDHVCLVSGRRTAAGDPLMPSRLLVARDRQKIASVVKRFYGQTGGGEAKLRPLLEHGEENGFGLIEPIAPDKPLDHLRVTGFKDYIACPYRFYLKYVLGLKRVDEVALEMDARLFGILTHDVLCAFGRSRAAVSTNPQEITASLEKSLDQAIDERFGQQPSAAIVIQREQLLQRLHYFANWQARRTDAGWVIRGDLIEKPLEAEIRVDDQPFLVSGRIDRIDYHDHHGYQILDYKTGKIPPETTHRKGPVNDKQWIDLQLPLYLKLTQSLGLAGDSALGYILVSEDASINPLSLGNWDGDALAAAETTSWEVIRGIRNNIFWPPVDPPPRFDDYPEICMVQSLERFNTGEDEENGGDA